MAPTVGRIVHYDSPLFEEEKILPAMIIDVHNETCVNLQVFNGTGSTFETSVFMGDSKGQWHWPPKVDTAKDPPAAA
jgi:hypothetical protein